MMDIKGVLVNTNKHAFKKQIPATVLKKNSFDEANFTRKK